MFPDITRDDIFRLETRRLWLRWMVAADAPAINGIAGIADVAQMTASIPHPYPAGEAERFILHARAMSAAGHGLFLAVTLKTRSRALIGFASAQSAASHEVEIGYVIAPSASGHGYASEAVKALIDTIFHLTETRIIVASARTDNPASRRVLEKCGCHRTGTEEQLQPARGCKQLCDVFALKHRDWSTRHREPRLPAMAEQQQPADRTAQSQSAASKATRQD